MSVKVSRLESGRSLWGTHRVALVAAALMGGVISGYFGLSVAFGASSEQSVVETTLLQAMSFEQNMGSMSPVGFGAGNWELSGDPLSNGNGSPSLKYSGRGWINSGGEFVSAADLSGGALLARQTTEADSLFAAGPLRDRVVSALTGDLASEEQVANDWSTAVSSGDLTTMNSVASRVSGMLLPGPGGASAVNWESVDVSGGTATVHALIEIWNSPSQVSSGPSGKLSESVGVATGQEDTYATLAEVSPGNWQVTSLDYQPVGVSG